MHARRAAKFVSLRLLFIFALIPVSLPAQTAQPITSLPRPSGETTPATTQQPAPSYPDNSVHPITSLPKPPQPPPDTTTYSTAPTPTPTPPPPTSQPSPAIDNTPAPSQPLPPAPQPPPTLNAPLVANIPTADHPPTIVRSTKIHPFSTFAAAFKVGLAGIGLDVATPLAQHLNLRAGGSIFSYTGTYNDSGDAITGTAQLRSGSLYLDYFPFHNGFRISPGMVINGNHLNATTLVPPGTEFDLGDGTYYSSASDPVHGTATFDLGRKIAPSFTIGFGNMIPRSNKHISFPFEIGFAYNRAPTIVLTLIGSVCPDSTQQNCQKIDNDPSAQADLQKQQSDINADIRFLRFYPILSQGISIKF